jgi:hypothetical protein
MADKGILLVFMPFSLAAAHQLFRQQVSGSSSLYHLELLKAREDKSLLQSAEAPCQPGKPFERVLREPSRIPPRRSTSAPSSTRMVLGSIQSPTRSLKLHKIHLCLLQLGRGVSVGPRPCRSFLLILCFHFSSFIRHSVCSYSSLTVTNI